MTAYRRTEGLSISSHMIQTFCQQKMFSLKVSTYFPQYCYRSRLLAKTLCASVSRNKSTVAAESGSALLEMENDERLQAQFGRARLGKFTQAQPQLGNQYEEDSTLKTYLRRHIPQKVMEEIEPDLTRFGNRVATEMYDLHLQCEREPPYLEKYNAWGDRVDNLVTSPAWKRMREIAAKEGLVSIAYERKYGEWSRLYSVAKLYLYSPSSGLYSCPLAMTDGAAKIIDTTKTDYPWLVDRAMSRLTSRSPDNFWTSGQWMTEKRGGSDVANGTETVAVPQSDGTYRLYGYKWFSSATDADMTFTLARVASSDGQVKPGTHGLSLFYLEVRDDAGKLNNIEMVTLKNKLGTRQLPTAELLLDGTVAYRVSEEGRGVPAITNMLTISRIHNALASAAAMRRMLSLSRDYSTRRTAFGNVLQDYPLHMQTLARMEIEARAATLLCLENARLLGLDDVGMATEMDKNLLRLLVPLAKLYTAKQAMAVATEGVESFGGQGYIEDTGIPSILRDAQVLTIWEGTTNVLSLDVLRAIAKSQGGVLSSYHTTIKQKVTPALQHPQLKSAAEKIQKATNETLGFVQKNVGAGTLLQTAARDLAYSLCRSYMGALLLDHAASPVASDIDVYAAERWCEKDLAPVVTGQHSGLYSKTSQTLDHKLVFDSYQQKSPL